MGKARNGVIEKIKGNALTLGLAFTVVSAVVSFVLSWVYYLDDVFPRMSAYLYDCGVDTVGTFVCAALFFGSMRQEGEGTREFKLLVVLTCFGFLANSLMYVTADLPSLSVPHFATIILGKLVSLALSFNFYRYVRETLGFTGRLAAWAEKGLPILLAFEVLVVLANAFLPVTFFVDENGAYQSTDIFVIEDLFFIVTSIVSTALIIRSESPRNQKIAALTFILRLCAAHFRWSLPRSF